MIELIETTNILGRELKIFVNKENPLFLARDVADWIGHTNVSEMVRNLDDGTEKVLRNVDTLGGNQAAIFLTEFGVYEILMTSRKKLAKEIRTALKAFLRAWRGGVVKVIANHSERANSILLATKNLLELSTQHEERINSLEYKFENQITIENYQRNVIRNAISRRVHARCETLGEGINVRELYSAIHKELRNKFNVSSYGDIKNKDYELALEWLKNWIENSSFRK